MEIAYVAGLFDGEGSIYLAPKGKSVQISLTQKETPILYLLKSQFGGSICKYGKQVCHKWRLHTIPEMIVFLELITPFLFIKVVEARIALELLKGMRVNNLGCHPLSDEEKLRRQGLYEQFRQDRIESQKLQFYQN